MKRLTLSSLAIGLLFAGLHAQEKFTLQARINGLQPGNKLFLMYRTSPDTTTVDSIAADATGTFRLTGTTLHPQKAYIWLMPANADFRRQVNYSPGTPVYLEKGTINITADEHLSNGLRQWGTRLNDELQAYNDLIAPFNQRYAALIEAGHTARLKGEAEQQKVSEAFTRLAEEREAAEWNYFHTHPDSEIALDWLRNKVNMHQEKTKAQALFNQMSDRIKQTAQGQAYARRLAEIRPVEVGSPAPDFTAKDINGKDVTLSSFRGQYVLLDFWASWCTPCRRENPYVLKAYNAYKEKNFTVVGFSLDNSEHRWKTAVRIDKLPWTQLCDLTGNKETAAQLYGVQAIPSNFLISPEGKIVALNLRGDALEKRLSELLK